jgi:molybdopterin-binding protein
VPEGNENDRVRVQIAFEGGQIVAALVSQSTAEGLAAALGSEAAVFDLETDDGTYLLALGKVVYVKRSSRETHIGFGVTS